MSGWTGIIGEYEKLGCYSPQILKSLNGNYAERVIFRKKPDDPDALPGLNPVTQESVIEILLDTLRYLRQFYAFSETEVSAAPLLLKYMTCIFYEQLSALEKYADDEKKLTQLFDFMKYELKREDIDFRGAMLG